MEQAAFMYDREEYVMSSFNLHQGGHGIGLEINEAPVLAPRMKQELEPGMVFALEPKIVLPGVGPLGIENSWVVTADGVEKLTLCKEEIIEM